MAEAMAKPRSWGDSFQRVHGQQGSQLAWLEWNEWGGGWSQRGLCGLGTGEAVEVVLARALVFFGMIRKPLDRIRCPRVVVSTRLQIPHHREVGP